MIKAAELRIGNCIYHMGEIVIIDAVDSDGNFNILADSRGNISCREDVADPILLTPEILEKCGFERSDSDDGAYWILNGVSLYETSEGFELVEEDAHEGNLYHLSKPFQSIHQLQNLFFSLTGEELNVQL